jgi:hypothetical protein
MPFALASEQFEATHRSRARTPRVSLAVVVGG